MDAGRDEKFASIEAHRYTPESEADVLRVLHAAFGQEWGNGAFWRWKHSSRPGFSPADVRIYTSGATTIGCWHMFRCLLRLAPGLEVLSSFEGDYALHPGWRGLGIGRDQATLREVRTLADRGIVARFGFTSQVLYERVYRDRLGHRQVPTVTAQYRKLLSDKAICKRLQAAGEQLRAGSLMQRLVRSRPLIVQVEVGGFLPCSLVIEGGAVDCRMEFPSDPDLIAKVPYALLTISRRRPVSALLMVIRALAFGRVRIQRLSRFAARCVSALRG